MARFLFLLVVIGLVFGVTGWIVAQRAGSGNGLPLDLPSGGLGHDDGEEEELEAIHFYGTEYEGDSFFWCLDKSGSMMWGCRLMVLKQEMSQAISSLSSRSQISMLAFSTSSIVWQHQPVNANSAMKASALAWVQQLQASGTTCMLEAGLKTVNISNTCSKRNKQMIFVGDGGPNCNGGGTAAQCLAEITGANWQRTPINTVYISTDDQGSQFMQTLALANNGTFTVAH